MRLIACLLLAAPITVRYDDVDAAKIVAEIAASEKAAITLDGEYAGKKISLDVDGWKLPEVLEQIAKAVGGKVYRTPDGTHHIVPVWKHALLKRLHESRLGLKAMGGMTFGGVLQSLRESTGVPGVIDPQLKNRPDLTLSVDKVTGAQLLDLITAPNELKWELRYGVVFIARPDRLAELPAYARFGALPDKHVELPFERTPMVEALTYLAHGGDVEITGDVKDYEHIEVTLKLPSLEFRHALAVILLPHDLTAKVKGGKIVVQRVVRLTPFPAGDERLQKEAAALDAARRITSKVRLDKVSNEAIERLDELVNAGADGTLDWELLYLGEWYALRGTRLNKKGETDIARDYFKTLLQIHPEAATRDAARRALKRLSR